MSPIIRSFVREVREVRHPVEALLTHFGPLLYSRVAETHDDTHQLMTTFRLCAALLVLAPCFAFAPLAAGRSRPNMSASNEPRVVPLRAQDGTTTEDEAEKPPVAPSEAGGSNAARSRVSPFAIHRHIGKIVGSLQPLLSRGFRVAGMTDEDLRGAVTHTLAWICYGALALTCAGTLGVDIKPLLGLSTLFGFALSISAKSILSNTISAAYVLWVRPFKRGDRITVCEFGKSDKYTGTVLSIDYHFVRLRTEQGNTVMVPSHAIYGKVVELPSTN